MSQIIRLRADDQILGYSKKIYGNTFYSKDLYAWNGTPIKGWVQEDLNTSLRDKNNQIIFEEDIVLAQYKSGAKIYLHVVHDADLEQFLFFDFKSSELIIKGDEQLSDSFEKSKLHRISYSFLN